MADKNKSPYTTKEKVYRILWYFGKQIFKITPRQLWPIRTIILKMYGARIGENVRIYPSVDIFMPNLLSVGSGTTIGWDTTIYNLGFVTIGENVTISQRCHLCAGSHRWQDPDMALIRSKIKISADVWLAAEVFVGPKVTIGEGTVIGARCSIMTDIKDNKVVKTNNTVIEDKVLGQH